MQTATAFTARREQADPADWPDDRRPSNPQWSLVAGLWLLAAWTPESTPGWAPTLVFNKTEDCRAESWPAPLEKLAAIAELPQITGAVPYASTVSEDDHATPDEELVSLIAGAVHADDARRMSLVRHLANEAAGPYVDLVRLTTTDDDPALHLLQRRSDGTTVRITLGPAATVQEPPVIADDGADGAFRTRIACLSTLLSDLLWVNNNNPVDFRFHIGTRPEPDTSDEDRLAAAARWWSNAEGYANEQTFQPITFAELRTSLHNHARGGLIDLYDGSWSGIEEMPEIPAGHVVTHLVDDLVDVIEDRLGGALVAVKGYLPIAWPPDEAEDEFEEYTHVLFVRGNEVGVLEIDCSC